MTIERATRTCQSCDMPLKRDPDGGGTRADGSRSPMYCSHCYRNGCFTQPDITVGQMKALVKVKLQEMGFPGPVAGLFTWGIPRLERWRSAPPR